LLTTENSRIGRLLRAGLACLFLLPALAHANEPVAPPVTAPNAAATEKQAEAAAIRKQVDTAPNRGLLYSITDGNDTLYLFGTIHVGKPEYYPLNRQVIDAVRSSKYLAVEVDISDEAAIAKLMAQTAIYTGTDSLDQHISPTLMQRLEPVLEQFKIPMVAARKMKPWLLALTLDFVGLTDSGYGPQYGADAFLIGVAKGMKKPVAEVESMQLQLQLFDNLTPTEQEQYLASTVDEIESGQYRTEITDLVEAWAKADGPGLAKAVAEGEAALPRNAKWISKKLIKDRNITMTRRIDEYLHSGSQYFVALGAAHLVGDDGIVARLKAKGYKVRDLQHP
jgi:uncharacterized protein YbaP (TraB family)